MSSPRFPHLAQRMFNVPLMIRPEKAELIVAALAERLGIAHPSLAAGDLPRLSADSSLSEPGPTIRRGYELVAGVAVIEICGTLVQKLGTLRPYSGMTGYDGIRQNLLTALSDPDVRGIALDIDSPGGEVAGCFDLADQIFALRGRKPIHAILTESAYSAAYLLASAADRISVPRTGGAGSIGVIAMLMDYSKALEQAGLAAHFVVYGARKAEAGRAALQGISDELLRRLQPDIDAAGELFVATVARNRGISADAVRDQQADCFMGQAAVDQRLADAVAAPDQAFRALLAALP